MKKDKLIKIYYKLIEKQNLFFLNGNSLNIFLLLKMRSIKRRIFKNLDSDATEKLILDNILNKIDNNRNLKKLANIYNQKKSVESLQAYISYKNKLSKKFGFNNFQDIIIKKISLYSHSKMDIDKVEFQIKELRISNFKRNYNVNFHSIDIENLLSFDKMVIGTYKNLEKNGYILENSCLTCGALSLYMPHSKRGIIILKDKKNNDFDFIAHEIGHLLEYYSLDDKNLLPNVLLVQPMKEFYSSLCEIRALESNKNIPEVTKLINEFHIQIKVLYIKIKFEEFLCTTQNKLNELNLNEKWKELTKKFFYEKSNDENFKWNLNYNISMDSFDKWMYFLGKFFANQVNKEETKIKKPYSIKRNDDFLEILKITNFDKDIDF